MLTDPQLFYASFHEELAQVNNFLPVRWHQRVQIHIQDLL